MLEEKNAFFKESTEYVSQYYYCLITPETKMLDENLIYNQLKNIQANFEDLEEGNIKVKVMKGMFNDLKAPGADGNKTYFLIYVED